MDSGPLTWVMQGTLDLGDSGTSVSNHEHALTFVQFVFACLILPWD